MRLKTEVSIDIDRNRKVWLVSIADDVDVHEVEEVVESMAGSLLKTATEAFNTIVPDGEGQPRMPRTFQED